MLHEFTAVFKKFKFISIEDIKALYSIARIKQFEPGEIIVSEGQVFPYAIFVIKGLLRNYMLTSSGDEKSLKFTDKKDGTGVPESLFGNKPSPEFIEALEPSTVILIDSRQFYIIAANRPKLLKLRLKNMEKVAIDMVDRIRFFTILTPEERFLELMQTNSSLIDRVEDRHLASFIGVTSVSFSRIKSRTKSLHA